jgi:hypothetical protein
MKTSEFLQQPVGGARLALPLVAPRSLLSFLLVGSFSLFLILSLPPKVLESFNGLSHGGAPLWLIVAH